MNEVQRANYEAANKSEQAQSVIKEEPNLEVGQGLASDNASIVQPSKSITNLDPV